ncbi:MAG TPA: hypothetical protein P5081_11625 [Phycisphaerae bacterium]|nr:hypothetical protein [Phycisphaerae bacterium]HRW53529.1 hypothetical protein [Phycisphaerae bacterium]
MRYAFTGILAGLAMFAWSAVSWMALPLHEAAFSNFPDTRTDAGRPDSDAPIAQLRLPTSGVYHYPGFPQGADATPDAMRDMADRMRAGPVVSLMIYHAEGRDPFPPLNFVLGALSCIVAAWVATCLTHLAAPRLPSFGRRVLFVASLGAFVFFSFYAQSWLWWGYPLNFGIAETIDILVAPLLAGLVIAAFVKHPAPAPA